MKTDLGNSKRSFGMSTHIPFPTEVKARSIAHAYKCYRFTCSECGGRVRIINTDDCPDQPRRYRLGCCMDCGARMANSVEYKDTCL
jgi:hypothetical protein